MATYALPVSAKSSITITLASLASATYVASSAVDLTSIDPTDVIIEVEITPGTVSGNKQAKIFIQTSIDGTDYSTGPTSGTTVTDEPNLIQIGTLPLLTNSTLQRRMFSVAAALGWVPPYFKLVVFNDSGAAFAGSGCSAGYATQTGTSV